MSKLKVTLMHSVDGHAPNQCATIRGLGFRKREQTVTLDDTPSVRGMIDTVAHLVEVERVED